MLFRENLRQNCRYSGRVNDREEDCGSAVGTVFSFAYNSPKHQCFLEKGAFKFLAAVAKRSIVGGPERTHYSIFFLLTFSTYLVRLHLMT